MLHQILESLISENAYIATVAVALGIWILISLGQNVIMGYAKQPMLGYAALYGVGGYTAAILATQYGFPFLLAMLAAIAVTSAFGFFVGWISLRTVEDYLAIVSIGINFVVYAILLYTPFFGGPRGVFNIPRIEIMGYSTDGLALATVWALVIGFILLDIRLSRSKLGLAFRATGEDELATQVLGTNTKKMKIIAFTIGSAYAGVVGTLIAFYFSVVHPSFFTLHRSIEAFAMPILGGVGTTRGAVAGAVILYSLIEALRPIGDFRLLVYGSLLVFTMLFASEGLLGREGLILRMVSWAMKEIRAGLMHRPSTSGAKLSAPVLTEHSTT